MARMRVGFFLGEGSIGRKCLDEMHGTTFVCIDTRYLCADTFITTRRSRKGVPTWATSYTIYGLLMNLSPRMELDLCSGWNTLMLRDSYHYGSDASCVMTDLNRGEEDEHGCA